MEAAPTTVTAIIVKIALLLALFILTLLGQDKQQFVSNICVLLTNCFNLLTQEFTNTRSSWTIVEVSANCSALLAPKGPVTNRAYQDGANYSAGRWHCQTDEPTCDQGD